MRKDSARKIGAITQNGHFALQFYSVDNMINHTGAVSNYLPFIVVITKTLSNSCAEFHLRAFNSLFKNVP